MNQFMINGAERPAPIGENETVGNLMVYVRSNLLGDSALLSSLVVDGVEIADPDEPALSSLPLSQLDSVQLTIMHPREMVEDTLQSLLIFTQALAPLSRKIGADGGDDDFQRLIDGVQTLAETVTSVREFLRIGIIREVNVLETDLVTILNDLLRARQEGNRAHHDSLLSESLPANLEDWVSKGIPALIRCRDS
jgi:hypothetical protein